MPRASRYGTPPELPDGLRCSITEVAILMRPVMDYEQYWIRTNWIKIDLWIRTFSEDEKAAFEKLGNDRELCMIAWMTQRWCRIGNPDKKPIIPCDPDLRKAISLMKKLGVPWDRMLPSDYD